MKFATDSDHPHKEFSTTFSIRNHSRKNLRLSSDPNIFWRTIFNFCYYTLVVPYRFKQEDNTGVYYIQTNVFQKVSLIIASINHHSLFV